MSLLIVSPGKDPEPWVEALKNQHPGLNIVVYPEDHDKEEVNFALTWKHPRGLFRNYPNLKVVASMGAGVDHITSDPGLPEGIKITRVVDPMLAEDMAEFILALILSEIKNLPLYQANEKKEQWKPRPYRRNKEVTVGILGLGVMGKAAARLLVRNGFRVRGWSRTSKDLEGISSFSGTDELKEFLGRSEFLVNLLPLTPETEKILNKTIFEQLPAQAYLINVARGEHLVEHDLLETIDQGHLSGAALDVFWEEPLRKNHPFWEHPRIRVTPHIASATDARAVLPQIVENYERMMEEEPLKNVVERKKGY